MAREKNLWPLIRSAAARAPRARVEGLWRAQLRTRLGADLPLNRKELTADVVLLTVGIDLEEDLAEGGTEAVSYTHLTLPTNREV